MKIIKTNKQTKTFETFCCCIVTLERSDQYPPPSNHHHHLPPRPHTHVHTHTTCTLHPAPSSHAPQFNVPPLSCPSSSGSHQTWPGTSAEPAPGFPTASRSPPQSPSESSAAACPGEHRQDIDNASSVTGRFASWAMSSCVPLESSDSCMAPEITGKANSTSCWAATTLILKYCCCCYFCWWWSEDRPQIDLAPIKPKRLTHTSKERCY